MGKNIENQIANTNELEPKIKIDWKRFQEKPNEKLQIYYNEKVFSLYYNDSKETSFKNEMSCKQISCKNRLFNSTKDQYQIIKMINAHSRASKSIDHGGVSQNLI